MGSSRRETHGDWASRIQFLLVWLNGAGWNERAEASIVLLSIQRVGSDNTAKPSYGHKLVIMAPYVLLYLTKRH